MHLLNSASVRITTADPWVDGSSTDAITSATTWLNNKTWKIFSDLGGQEAG